MRLTNINWDGSESSISIPDYGEFEVRDRIAVVPDMAGVVLLYTRQGEQHGFRSVEEVIEVQPITEEGAPVVAPPPDGAAAPGDTTKPEDTPATGPVAGEAPAEGGQPTTDTAAASYAEESQPSGKARTKKV